MNRGVESVDRTGECGVERCVDGDVFQTAQHARPFLKREAARARAQVEHRWPIVVLANRSGKHERRAGRFDVESIEEPTGRPPAERTGNAVDREIRRVTDPRQPIEGERPPHGRVREREDGVERLEVGRHVGGAEVDRIGERDPPVDDFDRLHGNRTAGSASPLLGRFAADERAQIPFAVRLLRAGNMRPHEPQVAYDDALVHELANAVVDGDLVDVNERVRIARYGDVTQRDPPEQRALEIADRERGGQVLIRLTHDQIADAVFRPAGFNDGERDAGHREDDCDQNDEKFSKGRGNRAQSSKWRHHLASYQGRADRPLSLLAVRADEREQPIEVEWFLEESVRFDA